MSAQQLGASLRAFVEQCLVVGDRWQWEPDPESDTAARWLAARHDPMASTIAEADAHAIILLRSGLEHAVAAAQAISAGRAFVPLTVGRTAGEHCLRAQYLLDPGADEHVRAGRRLNEWLYAVSESERQRLGIVNAGHPRSEEIKDAAEQLGKVNIRAAALGMTVKAKGDRWYIDGIERRASTMALSEQYLSNPEAGGVTSTILRTTSAVTHGTETGLLAAAVEVATTYDVQSMRPQQMDSGSLAFALMAVPLAAFNATRAMAERFERGADEPPWGRLIKLRDSLFDTWGTAISADLDTVAPDRPRTGLFGPLEK